MKSADGHLETLSSVTILRGGAAGPIHRVARGRSLLVMIASLFVLDGCQVIKGIFEAGFGIGVVVVIAVVATIGGIVAMVVSRK